MFQSSFSGGACVSRGDAAGDGGETEEAWRMVEGDERKATLRLLDGTRRFEAEELFFWRRGEVEFVVLYAQGVKSVGWSRQPIAAVRRGVATNIMKLSRSY